jgi:hypothetical protein
MGLIVLFEYERGIRAPEFGAASGLRLNEKIIDNG